MCLRTLAVSHSKSSTGVDWFIVDTEPGCAVRIHRAVDYWAKHIVEQVKNMPSSVGSRNNVSVSRHGVSQCLKSSQAHTLMSAGVMKFS